MVGLAFLTDPPVVEKTLTHLKIPATPPSLAPARRGAVTTSISGMFPRVASHPCETAGGFSLPEYQPLARAAHEQIVNREDRGDPPPPIRPPPAEEPTSG